MNGFINDIEWTDDWINSMDKVMNKLNKMHEWIEWMDWWKDEWVNGGKWFHNELLVC